MEVPEHLVHEILAGRCVAFVGAGFSAPVVATWRKLLLTILDQADAGPEEKEAIHELVEHGNALDLEAAGQLIQDCFRDDAFEQALSQVLRVGKGRLNAQMERRRAWLEGIPFEAVLTLNFDDVIEGAGPEPGTYRQILREPLPWWLRANWNDPTLKHQTRAVKLHGDVGAGLRNPVVLTREAYRRRLYHDARYANFLRTIFATRTVLYLGVSFTDAYLNELRSEVLSLVGAGEDHPSGYAILPNRSAIWCKWFQEHEGIGVLPYWSRDDDHVGFDDWLRAIHDRTSASARVEALLSDESGGRAQVVWVDLNWKENNAVGIRWLKETAKARLQTLEHVSQLNEREHASARLLITRMGYEPSTGAVEAFEVLAKVSQWPERPPVIVFGSGDFRTENRTAVLRRGAWEFASDWRELFGLIEHLFGRTPGRPPPNNVTS